MALEAGSVVVVSPAGVLAEQTEDAMRSIGLDVGKHFAEVAIREPGGRTRSGGRISASPDARTLGPADQVVLEATTNTWAIVELLERHAGRVVVSNPLRTRAIADAKVRTDTIDAATLAELLAADYLPTVWQPDPATRALRRRVAARAALVAERTRLRNRISAVLIRNLVASPWSDTFGTSGRALADDGRAARGRARGRRPDASAARRPGNGDRGRRGRHRPGGRR
jgi:transposase